MAGRRVAVPYIENIIYYLLFIIYSLFSIIWIWRAIRESPLQNKKEIKFIIFAIPVGNAVLGVPIKSPQTYNYYF